MKNRCVSKFLKNCTQVTLCAVACSLASCASSPLVRVIGVGTVDIATDPTGVTMNQDGYLLWTHEGVPAEWFVKTPQGWHISTVLHHQGNLIRLNRVNALAPTNTATGKVKPGS